MAEGVILSLGSVNLDIQLRAPRWPELEETLPAEEFTLLGGGKAANVAFLARRLGRPALLLARVGDDAFADQALDSLRQVQVDLTGVRRVPGEHTGTSLIAVQPGGKKGILLAENANLAWSDDDGGQAERLIGEAPEGSVLVVDFEIPVEVAVRCIEAARRRGLRVVVDPSPADRVPARILAALSAVTPNAGEAEKLTGCEIGSLDDAVRSARRMSQMGVECAIVKLDDGGCVFVRDGRTGHIPPPTEVEPVDTTGAGDAFTGALAVALLEGQAVEEAARMAVMTAQMAIQYFGSQPAYPDRTQLDRAMREHYA